MLLLEPCLCRVGTLLLVDTHQLLAEIAQLRMELQQQPVLLQCAADQEARATHQQGGKPENRKYLPEQPHWPVAPLFVGSVIAASVARVLAQLPFPAFPALRAQPLRLSALLLGEDGLHFPV